MITNNADFYQYMMNLGVPCTYMLYPPDYYIDDELVIVFTNKYHAVGVCGNAHQNKYEREYERECSELLDWLECGERVIMISNIIKLGTPYMAKNYKLLQQRYNKLNITKQVIHSKEIGELLVPHKLQIRYVGVKPIQFDIVDTHMYDHKYEWHSDGYGLKRQQQHYLNVINASRDTKTRRKLRYIPEYTLFSQLYKKLCL